MEEQKSNSTCSVVKKKKLIVSKDVLTRVPSRDVQMSRMSLSDRGHLVQCLKVAGPTFKTVKS